MMGGDKEGVLCCIVLLRGGVPDPLATLALLSDLLKPCEERSCSDLAVQVGRSKYACERADGQL